ncbi:zf-HC2 domain-containing protein [Aminipila sp.]|uniref:zf-HC2 domain-containing protein n=1 Tax=Aminipila sp. TaxID=2060095 RepID=UPI002897E360|nr:zf-HC2 domain-containing protein [Aminipila sp.]
MKCEIIRDLLPSYIDGLTSEESNLEIEKHINECSLCNDIYDHMRVEMKSQRIIFDEDRIKPFKKLNRRILKSVVATVLICAMLVGVYLYFFTFGWKVNSEDMNIHYDYKDGSIYIEFELLDGRTLTPILDRHAFGPEKVINFRECFSSIIDDRGEYPNQFSYGIEYNEYFRKNLDDDNCVILNFKDKTEILYYKDIVKELKLKK